MVTTTYTMRYREEHPYLEAALKAWCGALSDLARTVDRGATVSGRVKTHRSVLGKVFRKQGSPRPWESLGDLVALKAIFPTTQGVEKFTQLLCDKVDWNPKLDNRKARTDRLEYESKQFDLWREDVLDSQNKPIKIEVQVRTAAADAWYVVDHRLNYKGIVTLPEDLRRKVLRLTVLAEMFDQEVHAILEAQATLEQYGIARAYDSLVSRIDSITDGLAATSRPEALLETILGAYDPDELEDLEGIVETFADDRNESLREVIKGHQYESETFVEDRDWLYSEPEAILIAERSVNRAAMLKSALKGSNYEKLILPMMRAFQSM